MRRQPHGRVNFRPISPRTVPQALREAPLAEAVEALRRGRKPRSRLEQLSHVDAAWTETENDPKSPLASPTHTTNLSEPILTCVDADFACEV